MCHGGASVETGGFQLHSITPSDAGPYSHTINLPETSFGMRANSVIREPEIQKFWADNQVYEKLSRENPGVSNLGCESICER